MTQWVTRKRARRSRPALIPSQSSNPRARQEPRGHGEVYSAVFSRDGKLVLAAGDDGTARLWDTAHGQPLQFFRGHTGAVHSAAFSRDGKLVLTASDDAGAQL